VFLLVLTPPPLDRGEVIHIENFHEIQDVTASHDADGVARFDAASTSQNQENLLNQIVYMI
jgi:hypothetical protein